MMLTLPYPPTVNHYWEYGRGVVRLSKKGTIYRTLVLAVVLKEGRRPALAGDLAVRIDVYFPDRRKRDIDNLTKSILDSLEHAGVYADDNQVRDLWIRAMGVEKPGRVEVTLETMA